MIHSLLLLSLFLHLLAAVTWVGGSLFLVMVMVPLLREPQFREKAVDLLRVSGRKFRNIGWACLLTLVVTGVTNIALMHGGGFFEASFWKNPYAHILATKILLVVLIVILSLVHDLRVGPRAMVAWEQDPRSPETLRLRKQARSLGRVNLLLSLLVLVFALLLKRGLP